MKKTFKIISLLSIVFGFESAKAGCEGLAISVQPALFDIDQNNGGSETITVTRSSPSTGVCNYFILIENAGGSNSDNRYLKKSGTPTIRVQFYINPGLTNVVRSSSDAGGSSDYISGTMSSGVTQTTVPFYAYVNPAWVGSATGPNIERFDFKLYGGSNFNNKTSYATNASKQFRYTVNDSMSIALVNDGSPYNATEINKTLDFGSLTTGESLPFDLWLIYSNGYKLSLTSTNGGNLKNTAVTSSNLIPYTLSFDNVNVPLSSVETVVKTGTGSGTAGLKIDVLATIGNVGTVYSGTYSDTVTFKIAAP